jgi:hypothetical protein
MASNRNIEVRLRAIVEDFHLPGGRLKKIARLVANHLDWFEAAEARGMTWSDMVSALFAAGVTGRDGKPLSVGTLSSAVWRERTLRSSGRAEGRTSVNQQQSRGRSPKPASKPPLPKQLRRGGTKLSVDKSESASPPARSRTIEGNAASSRGSVLSFMKRTAILRTGRKNS